MATTLGVIQVSFADKTSAHPPALSSTRVESHSQFATQKSYENILGLCGLVITLSVISSGIYVFLRYLL
jgi:hypothetical protein